MFNRKTCNVASDIASSLRSRHTKITPASREMGVLIEQVIYPISQSNITWGADNLTDLIKTMSLQDMGDATVAGEQQQALQDYTAQMANTLKTNVNLTRSVAIPLIEKTYSSIQQRLFDFKFSHHSSMMMDVRPCEEYRLIDNTMFSDMVSKYGNSNFPNSVNAARVCSPMSYENLRELMKTGSDELDKEIESSLLRNVELAGSTSLIEKVWNKHFVKAERSQVMSTAASVSGNRGNEFTEWVLAFFMASGLLNNEIPDGVDVNMDSLKSIMNQYRAYCGYHVQRMIKNYVAKRSTGMLVIDEYVDSNGSTVLQVIPSVYEQAVEAGVTSEVIVGYKLLGGQGWFLDKLIKNKEPAAKAFQEMLGKRSVELQLTGRNIIRQSILEAVNSVSKQPTKIDDRGTTVSVDPSTEDMNNAMSGELKIVDDVFDEVAVLKVVQVAIANGVFAGTLVPLIIERMEIFSKDGKDVRYTGLMAAMSICVESMLSQFRVDLSIDK